VCVHAKNVRYVTQFKEVPKQVVCGSVTLEVLNTLWYSREVCRVRTLSGAVALNSSVEQTRWRKGNPQANCIRHTQYTQTHL